MERLIKWLIDIELRADALYSQAAGYFADNVELRNFLIKAAEDEVFHYHIMEQAGRLFKGISFPSPTISVDVDTRKKIEAIFVDLHDQLFAGSISEHVVLDRIMSAEFSEWNDIFIYVISHLKEQADQFKYAIAEIQNHRRYIENFLEHNEYGQDLLVKIRNLPKVWMENILIVEDNTMVAELLAAILRNEGKVDMVGNGKKALAKIKDKYYKLIISDVDMPVMDGLSFYTQVMEMFPGIKDRFIFITGDHSHERLSFFEQNSLNYLLKPAPIKDIRKEAMRVLTR